MQERQTIFLTALTLVSAIDRHYVVPFAVMLKSYRTHNTSAITRAYILQYDLTNDDIEFLQRVAQEDNIEVIFIKIPAYPFLFFKSRARTSLKRRQTMSPIAYAKAFLDRFLPVEIDRALCIDADVVINGSLNELLNLDFDEPIAAVSNIPRQHGHQFNSGVMLVDLEQWRRFRISDISEQFLFQYSDTLHSHDQHTLNLIFSRRWKKLPLKWNYMEDFYRFREKSETYSELEIASARENPHIIHYAVGTDKPWRRDCRHPRVNCYQQYRAQLRSSRKGLNLSDPQEWGWAQ